MAGVPRDTVLIPLASSRGPPSGEALSIRSLKEFVTARLPEDHPLRAVIVAERDALTPAEFLAKMEVWAVLLSRHA